MPFLEQPKCSREDLPEIDDRYLHGTFEKNCIQVGVRATYAVASDKSSGYSRPNKLRTAAACSTRTRGSSRSTATCRNAMGTSHAKGKTLCAIANDLYSWY